MNNEQSEVVKWGRREVDLVRRRQQVETEAGSLMLDPDPDTNADGQDRLAHALAELRAVEAAMKAARERRMEVIHARRAAEIQAIQDRQAELEKEQAALTAKIEKHRKALIELLGIEVRIVAATPNQRSSVQSIGFQIDGLSAQADRFRAPVPDSGMLDVDAAVSIDPLIDAVAAFEGSIPPVEELLKWAKSCEPVPGETFGDLRRRFHLVWTRGAIDPQQSSIYVEGLCLPGPMGTYSQKPTINVESGMFRAAGRSLKAATF